VTVAMSGEPKSRQVFVDAVVKAAAARTVAQWSFALMLAAEICLPLIAVRSLQKHGSQTRGITTPSGATKEPASPRRQQAVSPRANRSRSGDCEGSTASPSIRALLTVPKFLFAWHAMNAGSFLALLMVCTEDNANRLGLPITFFEKCLAVFWFGLVWDELKQYLRSDGLAEHLSTVWNILDFCYQGLLVVALVVRVDALHDAVLSPYMCASQTLFACALIPAMLRQLQVFSIHSKLGPLMLIVSAMAQDVMRFMVVLLSFVMAFSFALFGLMQGVKGDLGEDGAFWLPFWALFGSGNAYERAMEGGTAAVMLWLYLLISQIILVNLVVAIMSDSYAAIQEHSQQESRYARVVLYNEYMVMRGDPMSGLPIGVLVHVLRLLRVPYMTAGSQVRVDTEEHHLRKGSKQVLLAMERWLRKDKMKSDSSVEHKLEAMTQKLEALTQKLHDSAN